MAPTGPKSSRPKPQTNQSTWDERVIHQLIPFRRELFGLFLLVLSVITFLATLGLTSSGLLELWTDFLKQLTGWGVYPLVLMIAAIGIYLIVYRLELPFRVKPGQIIGIELILLVIMGLVHMALGEGLAGALRGKGGGLVGWALSEPLLDFLGPFLAILLIFLLAILGLALMVRLSWHDVIEWLNRTSQNLKLWSDELELDVAERSAQRQVPPSDPAPETRPIAPTPEIRIREEELIIIEDSAPDLGQGHSKRDRLLPPLDILEESSVLALSTEEIDLKKQIIEETLLDFGLPATVTEIRRGPAVTQFGVQPGYVEKPGPDGQLKQHKVRVSQIASLNKDLALALQVPRLRIEAPVPGRGIVGVEVPNDETSIVRLRAIMETDSYQKIRSPLAVALGRDVAGGPVVTDLATLPHLLIAGTTGSGKSVCLNALITCLAMNNRPELLRMVMIDPKKVELIRFNGLPHLLGKVEVEPDRVIGLLRWLTAEMDRRYSLFAGIGAKHLADFNRKVDRSRNRQLEVDGQVLGKLPYVAVFIDELADLMAMYSADVERTLCRLAQMARATGIHLVVATQRPSTDVITGLIKANFPARASFSVASGMDSRVILDTIGAESLMGRGDMLFLPPDASAPKRVQGVFVNDHEIEGVVSHWDKLTETGEISAPLRLATASDQTSTEPPWEKLIAREAFVSDRDEMLEEAIALAQKNDRISSSLIQRRLRVGYPRAARLMEILYDMGLVEDPKTGGKTRRTYISDEDDDPLDNYLVDE